MQALYDAIEQQLTEGDVQSFTDLTDSERVLFLERASQAIHDGNYCNGPCIVYYDK